MLVRSSPAAVRISASQTLKLIQKKNWSMIQAVNLFKTLLPSCVHASCLRACWLRGSWSGKNLLMRKLSPKHAWSLLLGPPDMQGQVFPSMDSMSFDPPEGSAGRRRQLVLSLDEKRPPLRQKGSSGLAWGAILWLSSLDEFLVHNRAEYGHTMGICVVENKKHIWKHLVKYIFHRSQHETSKTSVHHPPEKDTPLPSKTPLVWSQLFEGPEHFGPSSHTRQVMSRVEAFRDINPRSLLRELRTDIAMAVDDSFPLVYGLADKNIITDQLLKVSEYALTMADENVSSFFSGFSIFIPPFSPEKVFLEIILLFRSPDLLIGMSY